MKRLTPLLISCALTVSGLYAQQPAPIQELLERLEQNHIGPVTEVFNASELQQLREHFDSDVANINEGTQASPRRYATIENVSSTVSVIDAEDLSQILPVGPSNISEFVGAGVVRANGQEVLIVDNGNAVHIRGINNNLSSKIGDITGLPPGESVTGLEMRMNNLYALSTNGTGNTSLSMINQNNWQATVLGQTGQVVGIALGRDLNNNLYSYDIDTDALSQLDPVTGAGTLIGSIGFDANFAQGMTFDAVTSKLYMTAFNNTIVDSELREVNVNTGATINLGRIVPGITMQFGYSSYYDPALSVNDPDMSTLLVYPVPASRNLTISAEEPLLSVAVLNVLGQLVKRQNVDGFVVQLDVSAFPPGIYLLQIESSSGKEAVRKFVKK